MGQPFLMICDVRLKQDSYIAETEYTVSVIGGSTGRTFRVTVSRVFRLPSAKLECGGVPQRTPHAVPGLRGRIGILNRMFSVAAVAPRLILRGFRNRIFCYCLGFFLVACV